jgi:hypothetical protein
MGNQLRIGQNEDHIGGNFEWEVEPSCGCGRIKEAVADKFLFVSNFTDGGFNLFYMLPVAADGTLFRSDGVPISHCPWCGDKIKGRKKYSAKD